MEMYIPDNRIKEYLYRDAVKPSDWVILRHFFVEVIFWQNILNIRESFFIIEDNNPEGNTLRKDRIFAHER